MGRHRTVKKIKIILSATAIWLALSIAVKAQDTVPITLEDLRNFRKAVADAVFWEKTAGDRDRQIVAANKSASDWEKLYLAEKDRADRVQGGRVDALSLANTEYRIQRDADRQKIGEQQAEIIGLKSSRKWYVATGLVAGATAGFLGGRQTCGTSIPGLSRSSFEMPSPLRPAKDFMKP